MKREVSDRRAAVLLEREEGAIISDSWEWKFCDGIWKEHALFTVVFVI